MSIKYFLLTVILLMALLFVVSVNSTPASQSNLEVENNDDDDDNNSSNSDELTNELEKELFVRLFGRKFHHANKQVYKRDGRKLYKKNLRDCETIEECKDIFKYLINHSINQKKTHSINYPSKNADHERTVFKWG